MRKIFMTCAAVMFIAGLFAPLGSLFMRITPEGFSQVVHSPQFEAALWNSITTGLIATIISVTLGLAAAWSLERTAIRAKNFFAITFGVPMLIPSISHSFGLVALFGANGWLTNLFHWDFSIYGKAGIIAGSIMYAFPVAFFIFMSVPRCEDGLPYLAAEVMGVPRRFIIRDVILPKVRFSLCEMFAYFFVNAMMTISAGVTWHRPRQSRSRS